MGCGGMVRVVRMGAPRRGGDGTRVAPRRGALNAVPGQGARAGRGATGGVHWRRARPPPARHLARRCTLLLCFAAPPDVVLAAFCQLPRQMHRCCSWTCYIAGGGPAAQLTQAQGPLRCTGEGACGRFAAQSPAQALCPPMPQACAQQAGAGSLSSAEMRLSAAQSQPHHAAAEERSPDGIGLRANPAAVVAPAAAAAPCAASPCWPPRRACRRLRRSPGLIWPSRTAQHRVVASV
jgi:hypothetical protein